MEDGRPLSQDCRRNKALLGIAYTVFVNKFIPQNKIMHMFFFTHIKKVEHWFHPSL